MAINISPLAHSTASSSIPTSSALVALCLITTLLLASWNHLGGQEIIIKNGFAAKVDGKVITLAELNWAIDMRIAMATGQIPSEIIEREKYNMRPLVLRDLIERQLLLNRAARDGIVLFPGAVESHLQRTVEQLSSVEGTRFSVDDYLSVWEHQFGETEIQLRNRLKDELTIEELKKMHIRNTRSISPKKLREYYLNNPEEFAEDGRISFRQLLVAENDPDYNQIREEVENALTKNEDFTEVAKRWSMGPRQESGGLYEMSESQLDDFFPPVPKIVRSLETGETSSWFMCRGYAHKILLEKKEPGGALDFTKAQDQIRAIIIRKLENEKRLEFQKSLWQDSTIEIYISGLKLPKN
ncbi:MAG: SurA N-terminal domain-containing protein [Planctomycetota bacterium]|nr:SurA N-terminal domain-containing protein [Planctomycetota bacterium]